ncbi:hypothetical protein ABC304_13750 [Microbacterium sp. 1P10UB]|uniref:hypothetical protein n=1 Tax=unclassified Microbacterium TaxID=2609290 RepID=UPI0039A2D153
MTLEVERRRRVPVGRWLLVVVVALAALIIVALSGMTYGACYDSGTDPDASYCTSGPMVAPGAVWFLWGLWVVVAAVVVVSAVRGTLRR